MVDLTNPHGDAPAVEERFVLPSDVVGTDYEREDLSEEELSQLRLCKCFRTPRCPTCQRCFHFHILQCPRCVCDGCSLPHLHKRRVRAHGAGCGMLGT